MHSRPLPGRELGPAVFRPPRALGVIVGGGFVVWALVAAYLAANVALGSAAELKTLIGWAVAALLAVLAVVFANWTYSLWSMAYIVDTEHLTIRWGFREVLVPISSIQRLVPGRTIDESAVEGLNWWGCHVGVADVKRIGYTLFYSTHSAPEELLYMITSEASYALTVLDQAAFAEEIQARALAGPAEPTAQRSTATGVAALPFWRDRVASVTAAIAAGATLVLCAYVFARYPGLPSVIQLNYPALGGVVRVGEKSELLRIAYLGAGLFALNTVLGIAVHARERAAGLWLLASGGMLQAVLLAAAVIAIEIA